ncbi:MAG: hypothetical protein AB7O95_18420 [Geminicoccaceae bacterium]
MQPTTKALAQMLAGNTKISGQLVHARNVLAQANRMVDDRMPDRLPPAAREQFFEQLALLKLTIADAEEGAAEAEELEEAPQRPAPPVDAARLREVALRLATSEPAPMVRPAPPVEEEPEELPSRPELSSGFSRPQSSRPEREPAEAAANGDGAGTGPRRERLRLKPVQRPASAPDA